MPEAVVFAGPSTWGQPASLLADIEMEWRPPVRRGDIDQLVESAAVAGVVVVCDGVFQVGPAVSHAELCRAIDAGWQVWGVSSLGAIRAFELRDEGMRGFGEVFKLLSTLEDLTDDEMALLHFPEPPYFPLTEPLVNLRHALAQQGQGWEIAPAASVAVLADLHAMWFGDRTEAVMRERLKHKGCLDKPGVEALMLWLQSNRVKQADLSRLLASRPWLSAATSKRP